MAVDVSASATPYVRAATSATVANAASGLPSATRSAERIRGARSEGAGTYRLATQSAERTSDAPAVGAALCPLAIRSVKMDRFVTRGSDAWQIQMQTVAMMICKSVTPPFTCQLQTTSNLAIDTYCTCISIITFC